MVVVDGARRLINRTVEILVTSIHQTPAGKMIFGRLDDRSEAASPRAVAPTTGQGSHASNGGNGHGSSRHEAVTQLNSSPYSESDPV